MRIPADMHTHSSFSFDADFTPEQMVRGAAARGLSELCITDHLDFDRTEAEWNVPDFESRDRHMAPLEAAFPGLRIGRGAEVSLADEICARRAREALEGQNLDLIIGSVHTVQGANVWEAAFFEGRSQRENYRIYLEQILRGLETFPELDVLGHYDFAAHYAPYKDRAFRYDYAPDLFDAIFRWLLGHGKTLEINTSSWEQDPPWGLDVLTRYRELGGSFVTVGSDAHNPGRLGDRFEEAADLAAKAGLKIAAYRGHTPFLLP